MIGIIDYGVGNLHSVRSAFQSVADDVVLVSDPAQLASVDRMVLPGVGTFAAGLKNLAVSGLGDALREQVLRGGKPLLGICLGMQVLAREGTENGPTAGLALIPGTVEPLVPAGGLRVPHMGWHDISITQDCPVLDGLGREPTFYFVHSYHMIPDDPTVIVATVDYGGPMVVAVMHQTIMTTQFHPEKSQEVGIRLIQNFVDWEP